VEPSPKGPDRRVYARTHTGRDVLHEWLKSGPVLGNDRFAYIGQLIHMGELNDLDTTLEFLQQLREEFSAVLDLLRRGMEEVAAEEKKRQLTAEQFHEKLSMRMGVLSLTSKVQWCTESIEEIQKRRKKKKRKSNK
jgi:DNA-binding PadR family transcriptional regulator